MTLIIQQGASPAYRYTYFEHAGSRYLADMTDVNQLLEHMAILPRIKHVEVRIYPCDSNWQVNESQVLYYSNGCSFTDTFLEACVDQFISNQ